MKKKERYSLFVETMWDWYACHKRTLPWRDLEIADPDQRAYLVWVSEIMLQQTQVSRVITSYKNFIQTFPNIQELSKASNREVLMTWRGMGYNSRALRLRDGATLIVEKFNGKFPSEMDELRSIPGIGHYTAAAIRNFAFGIPTPCIDTNIRRILHRTFVGPEQANGSWKKDDRFLLKIAEKVLIAALGLHSKKAVPKAGSACLEAHQIGKGWSAEGKPLGLPSASDWHAALMDFGSLVCTQRNPKWDICPLAKAGISKSAFKTPIPIKKTKKEPGRLVGTKFIPNRIFRGKIIDALRDHENGLSIDQLGPLIAMDWNEREHREWLKALIENLKRDHLIANRSQKIVLSQ